MTDNTNTAADGPVAQGHTPGPWTAHHGWHDGWIDPDVTRKHPNWCEVTGPDGGPYLSINGHFGMANARLIAAAPDLHAAGREVDRLFLVIESAVRNADPINHRQVLDALKENRAAIAKATAQAASAEQVSA